MGTWKKIRFSLLELVAAVAAYGLVMACIQALMFRLQWPADYMVPAAVGTAGLLPAGLGLGAGARERILESAVFVRWLVFLLGMLTPPSLGPALVATIMFCLPDCPYRNDAGAVVAWLTLLLPVLGYFWFKYIDAARKEDQPPAPSE